MQKFLPPAVADDPARHRARDRRRSARPSIAIATSAISRCRRASARATTARPPAAAGSCSTASGRRTRSPPTSSARWRHDSRCRKRAHLRDPRLLQHPRARLQRRARRAHVVDQHDGRCRRAAAAARVDANASRTLRWRRRGRQAGLRRRRADAPERRGTPATPRCRARSAAWLKPRCAAPRRVERHRDDGVGALRAGPRRARASARPAAAPAIAVRRTSARGRSRAARRRTRRSRARVDRRGGGAPAPRAPRQRHADRAPGRQRIAAAVAERRREREDRAPARGADRTARRVIEQLAAGRAGRREDDRQRGRRSANADRRMQSC